MNATCRALACAAVCGLCGCALFTREPDPNVLTQQEEVNGWILLWDGDVPTNGWVGVSAGCSNFTARGWSVTNGALVASVGADVIRTEASYKDFDFKADYRLAPGASGRILYFHNAESDADSAFAYALAPLPPEALIPMPARPATMISSEIAYTIFLFLIKSMILTSLPLP